MLSVLTQKCWETLYQREEDCIKIFNVNTSPSEHCVTFIVILPCNFKNYVHTHPFPCLCVFFACLFVLFYIDPGL